DAMGFLQQRLQGGVDVFDRFTAKVAAHKGIFEAAGQRPGAKERQGNHNVVDAVGLGFAQRGAHPRAFDLEAADGAPAAHQFGGGRVVVGNFVEDLQAFATGAALAANVVGDVTKHG